MTPKEKAQELVSMFVTINLSQVNDLVDGIRIRLAKESALIAVDEILKVAEPSTEQVQYTNGEWAREYREIPNRYWTEVKQEIKNL